MWQGDAKLSSELLSEGKWENILTFYQKEYAFLFGSRLAG